MDVGLSGAIGGSPLHRVHIPANDVKVPVQVLVLVIQQQAIDSLHQRCDDNIDFTEVFQAIWRITVLMIIHFVFEFESEVEDFVLSGLFFPR